MHGGVQCCVLHLQGKEPPEFRVMLIVTITTGALQLRKTVHISTGDMRSVETNKLIPRARKSVQYICRCIDTYMSENCIMHIRHFASYGRAYVYIYIYIYMSTCIYAHMYEYISIYIYTYKYMHLLPKPCMRIENSCSKTLLSVLNIILLLPYAA